LLATWSGDIYKNGFFVRKQDNEIEVASGDRKNTEEENQGRKTGQKQ
jgi:hypothetical protein